MFCGLLWGKSHAVEHELNEQGLTNKRIVGVLHTEDTCNNLVHVN